MSLNDALRHDFARLQREWDVATGRTARTMPKRDLHITPSSGCIFNDLSVECPREGCKVCNPPKQAESWQEPPQQMEG